jgi:hypothetical protein
MLSRLCWLRPGVATALVSLGQGGARARRSEVARPMRTVFNSRTRRYEDIPLPEFQLLLRQGVIQAVTRRAERTETTYWLI